MYDIIKSQDKPVTTIAKNVMSIATIIYLAADRRITSKASVFMIHTPMVVFQSDDNGGVMLNRHEMTSFSDELLIEEKRIINYYKKATNISENQLAALMKVDNYFNGIEAYELGFATELKNTETYAYLTQKSNKMDLTKLIKKIINSDEPVIEETVTEEVIDVTPEELSTKVAELEQNLISLSELVSTLMSEIKELKDANLVEETTEESDDKEEELPVVPMDVLIENAVKAQSEVILNQAKAFYQSELTKLAVEVEKYAKTTKTNGKAILPNVAVQQNSVNDIVETKNFFDYSKLKR
jgi:hypothetical protein